MKMEYEPGKTYTALELEEIMRKGWETDDEYFDICEFILHAPMTQEEIEKLCAHGVTDELYDAMCP